MPTRFANSVLIIGLALAAGSVLAHDVSATDRAFFLGASGVHFGAYAYFGAKHMVTGIDHLLYLVGVIFLVYRFRDVAIFVTLFAVGHSITLLAGVLSGIAINASLVDAIIGLSVAYKAFENLGGFAAITDNWLDPRIAVFGFGLIHGLGLASKLQDLAADGEGFVTNLIAFNVGVEIGQLLAVGLALLAINAWRTRPGFSDAIVPVNTLLMTAGFLLMAYHLAIYFGG